MHAIPTSSHKHTTQQRAKIKGNIWYFDVSEGGNLTPSLVIINTKSFQKKKN